MPEYLAPGVYVEEVDTGPKPIEGVSTSTSGMVGITERGPVGVPTLVTGFADFRRQFGGYLDRRAFPDAWYLPHAVEGFFNNGGKRLYIVRALPAAATSSVTYLADRAIPTTVTTTLKEKAIAGTKQLKLANVTDVERKMLFKLDDRHFTEYVRVADETNAVDTTNQEVKLEQPLYRDHAQGASFEERTALLKIQAIDKGAWGNTLRITPDDDESLLETTVAAEAPSGQAEVTLRSTQGIEPGSIIEFFIQKVVAARTVVMASSIGNDIPSGTRVYLKKNINSTLVDTDWETTVIQGVTSSDTKILLESVERIEKDDQLEFLLDSSATPVTVDHSELTLTEKLGEGFKSGVTVYA